jgi:hypothetical protein
MIVDPVSQAVKAMRARLQTRFDKRWSTPIVPVPLSSSEFKRVASMTPFLAVGLSEVDVSGARILSGAAHFSIVIGVKNASNQDNRFLGDAAGPGLYPAMTIAAALINGHTVPDLCTFTVTRISSAYAEGFSDDAIAVGIINVTTTLSFRDAIADPDAPDFAGFSAWRDAAGNPQSIIDPAETV